MPRSSALRAAALAFAALGAASAHAQSILVAGPEFQVSQYATGDQSRPSVAVAPDGSSLVVWDSEFQDGSSIGVFGRRFDRAGAALGPEFQIAQSTVSSQWQASVGVDASGRYTVVWTGVDASGSGVFGRQFSRTGALGPEFLVNTYTTGEQIAPRVAVGRTGILVAWQSQGQDGSGWGVYGRLLSPTGTPVTGEVLLSTATAFDQRAPAVAALDNGRYAAAWLTNPAASGLPRAAQRLFDASLAPVTPEQLIAETPPFGSYQRRDYVSVVPTFLGQYAVGLWEATIFGGKDILQSTDYGVQFVLHTAAGAPVDPRKVVASGGIGSDVRYQGWPSVNANGGVLVAYTSAPAILPCFNFPPFPNSCPPDPPEDGSGSSVWIGAFGVGTDPSRTRVNTFTTGDQSLPSVAQDAIGNGVVAWQSANQDGSGLGIFARRTGGLFGDALVVDAAGNRVLDPEVSQVVQPSWTNLNGAVLAPTGILFGFVGSHPGTYTIEDGNGSYGSIANGATQACTDCYTLRVSFPAGRPAGHVDSFMGETLIPANLALNKTWVLHVGGSFIDVPAASPFYRFVETLLHTGVSAGCGTSTYCPSASTSRDQMAVFVLRAKEGAGYQPPACGAPVFGDVPASSPFCPWVEELVRRGVTGGCGGGNYCPGASVSREQMAVFVLKTLDPALAPPACTTPMFGDVPASSPFCRWVEEMARRGITGGCGGGNFCPDAPVTREQMAVFLTTAFALRLY